MLHQHFPNSLILPEHLFPHFESEPIQKHHPNNQILQAPDFSRYLGIVIVLKVQYKKDESWVILEWLDESVLDVSFIGRMVGMRWSIFLSKIYWIDKKSTGECDLCFRLVKEENTFKMSSQFQFYSKKQISHWTHFDCLFSHRQQYGERIEKEQMQRWPYIHTCAINDNFSNRIEWTDTFAS